MRIGMPFELSGRGKILGLGPIIHLAFYFIFSDDEDVSLVKLDGYDLFSCVLIYLFINSTKKIKK